MRKLSIIIALFSIIMVGGLQQQTVLAATPLPASSWYTVTYIPDTDTLHWVSPQGEQGSMSRPHLANEADNPATLRMKISPNGQHMVVIASLNNGNLGIGFYDFVAGQFIQSHEAQPNEALPSYSQLPFSFTGGHFAMVLRNTVSGDWRVIVFETATGNAVDVLTRTSTLLPDNFPTHTDYHPIIASFDIDEGIGQNYITLQTINNDPNQASFPSFKWYHNPVPAIADNSIVSAAFPFSPFAGYDVLRTNRATVLTGFDDPQNPPSGNAIGSNISTRYAVNQLPQAIVNGGGYVLNSPQWLNNGAWIGYRVQNNVHQPHYAITSAQSDTSLPLGPNIGSIHSTPDGFVAVNSLDWQLYHTTDLNMDAFAYQFGNTVFQSNGQPFYVVYTTPEGAPFSLNSLPTEANLNVEVAGNGGVQAPEQTCGTAPAPRLSLNENARVTYTNGAPLNIRTAPAGDYIMHLAEGTVVTVISGPSCADNYFWWQIQLESEGATVGGWAAEGDVDSYYLEPFIIELNDPLQVQPTEELDLDLQIVTVQPTTQLDLDLQVATLQPTAQPPLDVQVVTEEPTLEVITPMPIAPIEVELDCVKSPASQLSVGMTATSINPGGGTLAMRTNLSDPYPTHQLPAQKHMSILDGPQCLNGIRMWYVASNLNNEGIVGWIAEGVNNTYYIIPN